MPMSYMKKFEEESLPVIRIWAASPEADPLQHANMKKLADDIPHIQGLLAKHGIPEADFVPPVTSSEQDPHIHYEIHSSTGSQESTRGLREIGREIHERTELAGSLHHPLTATEREFLKKRHNLGVKWSAGVGKEQGRSDGR